MPKQNKSTSTDLMDKVFVLRNGQTAVPEQRLKKEVEQKNNVIKGLFNRLSSALTSRSKLFAFLGKSFSGTRDLYTICGYPFNLEFKDFKARYDRQELAKAAIDRPVNSSWRKKPRILDGKADDPKETKFEEEFVSLEKRLRAFSYLKRADTLSCLGRYSVVLLGFGDGVDLSLPVLPSTNLSLNYISVFSEETAKIVTWETEPTNERFALPVIYELVTAMNDGEAQQKAIRVHYTRVLHVVPEALESDIYGVPQMEGIYNRLQDLETIVSGSGEMYWKGARPGYGLSLKEDYDYDEDAKEDLKEELEEYDHKLRRFIRLQGFDITSLDQQIADPEKFLDGVIDLIAAGRNIPKRILMGSERGELASSEDKNNWNERMESRREDHIEPVIIRPFIDKLIDFKLLPQPLEDDYIVEWPEFEVPGEEAIVKNAEVATNAIAKYAGTPGIELVMPLSEYLQRFFGYSREDAEKMSEEYEAKIEEEDMEIEEDNDLEDSTNAQKEEK